MTSKSADDEERDWNFEHLDKINYELNQKNGSVGSVLASMLYQIQKTKGPQGGNTEDTI
jgi:hypothetical protein